MKFELHPLCALFPRMAGAEFEALKADIKANGLRQPIVTHNGMILDGGNRYAACMAVGVKPLMTEYTGSNLVTYVMSANFHRRHLSAGQQAAIVASATDWAKAQTHGGDRKADQQSLASLETVKGRAALSGAGTTAQKQADKLAREKPEVAKQVAQGEKSLYQAVKESKPQKAEPKLKPQPVADPALVAKLEDTQQAVAILSEDNDRLSDRLAVAAMDATEEERAAAAETIAQLRSRVRALEIEMDAVKSSRDSLMRENNELKNQCARQRKQLDKLKATV